MCNNCASKKSWKLSTHIYFQKSASIQPRTSRSKFADIYLPTYLPIYPTPSQGQYRSVKSQKCAAFGMQRRPCRPARTCSRAPAPAEAPPGARPAQAFSPLVVLLSRNVNEYFVELRTRHGTPRSISSIQPRTGPSKLLR